MKYICPFMVISIPSGAIKRAKEITLNLTRNLFQFLLVRLRVSVPCRALGIFIQFQFLLVRLRDSILSYLFREKVISIPSGAIKRRNNRNGFCYRYFISIPSGAIKSLLRLCLSGKRRNFNSFWCD